jgi:hypothetical protein
MEKFPEDISMAVNVVLYSEGVKHLDFRYNVPVLEAYNV